MRTSDLAPELAGKWTFASELRRILSLSTVGSVGALALGLAPLIVEGLTRHAGLTVQQSATCFSAEMTGLALGNVVILFLLKTFSEERIAGAGLVLMAVGNLASVFVSTFDTLIPLRVVTGLGDGATIAVAACLTKTRQPRVSFAFLAAEFILVVAAASALTPVLLERWAAPGLFLMLSASAIVSLPLLSRAAVGRPPYLSSIESHKKRGREDRWRHFFSCAMVCTYAIALSAFWSAFAALGIHRGLSETAVGKLLASALVLAGTAGCAIAGFSNRWIQSRYLIIFGCLAISPVMIGLSLLKGETIYVVGLACFLLTWNASYAPVFDVQAALDPTGRLVILGYLLLNSSFAIGPQLAAALIASDNFFLLALICSAGFLLAALFMSLIRPVGAPGARDVHILQGG